MLEELKERVCAANKQLKENGLVILTWGNVSAIDRESNLMVIKPSGVSYDELTPDKMVVVDMEGRVVEGDLNPSSDTPSHIALYLSFPEIGGIVHTHSRYATIWAQAGLDIVAFGTTHADYFYGDVPCTMPLEVDQIETDYEKNTGYIIADTFARRRINCMDIPACLVAYHGPFTWGATPEKAVENAIVLEEVAHMAVFNTNFQFGLTRIQDALLDKHYMRKHGDNAYYGQVTSLDRNKGEEDGGDIQIAPSAHTIELKNISEIATVETPVINRPPKKADNFDFGDEPIPAPDSEADSMSGGEPLDLGFGEASAPSDDMFGAAPDLGFADEIIPASDPIPLPPSDPNSISAPEPVPAAPVPEPVPAPAPAPAPVAPAPAPVAPAPAPAAPAPVAPVAPAPAPVAPAPAPAPVAPTPASVAPAPAAPAPENASSGPLDFTF